MSEIGIRPVEPGDLPWVVESVSRLWGSDMVVAHGQVYYPARLPGLVATWDDQPAGLLTYQLTGKELEVVTLASDQPGKGIGQKLLQAVVEIARQQGIKRVWLITTNDNTRALRFYQRFGFHLSALHPNALEASRRLKPQIPLTGEDDIPIRDELELEMWV